MNLPCGFTSNKRRILMCICAHCTRMTYIRSIGLTHIRSNSLHSSNATYLVFISSSRARWRLAHV